MATSKKFSSKLDEKTLEELRAYAKEQNTEIAGILNQAVKEFLQKKRLRPLFSDAADQAFSEFDEALKELAK